MPVRQFDMSLLIRSVFVAVDDCLSIRFDVTTENRQGATEGYTDSVPSHAYPTTLIGVIAWNVILMELFVEIKRAQCWKMNFATSPPGESSDCC